MKKILKGFTLIELIVVMAIFSIIMFTALAMIKPVSTQFQNTVNYENSRATLDNVRLYIESNLKYANRVNIYTGFDSLPTDVTGSSVAVDPNVTGGNNSPIDYFRFKYYLMPRSKSEPRFLDDAGTQPEYEDPSNPTNQLCNTIEWDRSAVDSYYTTTSNFRIYVMSIINADEATGDPGKISLDSYLIDGTLDESKEYAVNPAFFDEYALNVRFGTKVDMNSDGTIDKNDMVDGDYKYSEMGLANASVEIEAYDREDDGSFTVDHNTATRMTASFRLNNIVDSTSETIYAGIQRFNPTGGVISQDDVKYGYPSSNSVQTLIAYYNEELAGITDESLKIQKAVDLASNSDGFFPNDPTTFELLRNQDDTSTNPGESQKGNVYIIFTLPKQID